MASITADVGTGRAGMVLIWGDAEQPGPGSNWPARSATNSSLPVPNSSMAPPKNGCGGVKGSLGRSSWRCTFSSRSTANRGAIWTTRDLAATGRGERIHMVWMPKWLRKWLANRAQRKAARKMTPPPFPPVPPPTAGLPPVPGYSDIPGVFAAPRQPEALPVLAMPPPRGPKLGDGGLGAVYEMVNQPQHVVKEFHSPVPNGADLFPRYEQLRHALASERGIGAAWPLQPIVTGSTLRGFVMPRIPPQYYTMVAGRRMEAQIRIRHSQGWLLLLARPAPECSAPAGDRAEGRGVPGRHSSSRLRLR